MTSQHSNLQMGEEGARVPETKPQPSLDAKTLRQWQSELDGFVVEVRGRLQSLSDSVTQWKDAQRSVTSHTRAMPVPDATPETAERAGATPERAGNNPGRVVETPPPEHSQNVSVAEQPSNPSPDLERVEDMDPLERLKLRLAQQIENA